jgi:Tfp pilus assembly protein PilV
VTSRVLLTLIPILLSLVWLVVAALAVAACRAASKADRVAARQRDLYGSAAAQRTTYGLLTSQGV